MSERRAVNGFCCRLNFRVLGPPQRHIFTLFLLIIVTLIICYQNNQKIFLHNDRWSNHRIMIARIWPKITTLTTCEIWDFEAPLKSSFQIIFSWYSYQWLTVIRPTKVPKFIMIKLKLWKLWQCKFGWKCQFFRFLEVILTLNFYPDYRFQIQTF